MKKCASCAKDLPEAALHCVFCGAKQAAAPAVQPGLAKTSFGYSANDVMNQLGGQPPQPGGYQQPQQGYQPPRPNSPSQGGYPQPSPQAANAATMMVPPGGGPQLQGNPNAFAQTPPQPGYAPPQPGYAPPQPGYAPPQPGYAPPQPGYAPPQPGYAPPQPGSGGWPPGGGAQGQPLAPYGQSAGGMGIHSPPQPTPGPLPTAPAPYLGSQASARAGHPIDPWKDTLKLMMLVWGAIALVSFATPVHVSPFGFNWDLIIDGPGKMKIPGLLWAAAGLIAIVCAAIPMDTLPRGIIAAALGLAGIFVPIFAIIGMPSWQALLPIVSVLTLVPGLLIRDEYVESLVARVLVTIGVMAALVPLLIPVAGQIPLVLLFKGLIELPAEAKIGPILKIAHVVLVVTALLAWMPGPATGGAKVIAWALILFPVVEFAIAVALDGHIGDILTKQPGLLVEWAPDTVYTVLAGYGLATVIGKQLE